MKRCVDSGLWVTDAKAAGELGLLHYIYIMYICIYMGIAKTFGGRVWGRDGDQAKNHAYVTDN